MPEGERKGPPGDPARHLGAEALRAGLQALPAAPRSRGRVSWILARRSDGRRERLERAELSPEDGVPGDRWARRSREHPEMQLSVMQRDVAELIANGQPVDVFGDNLGVELDLSSENLPPGSQLRVGGALCEVTPEPHDGCRWFRARFGDAALRLVADRALRSRNLRGVYWRVREPGAVAVGDPVEVLRRPLP